MAKVELTGLKQVGCVDSIVGKTGKCPGLFLEGQGIDFYIVSSISFKECPDLSVHVLGTLTLYPRIKSAARKN